MNKEKKFTCPLCGSLEISLTYITKDEDLGGFVSIRLYCHSCKKAMTVTGRLMVTVNEVEG